MASKKDTVTYGQILLIDRLKNSRNGNPRYTLVLRTAEDGVITRANTMADIADSYAIGDPGLRVDDWVKVTLTPGGRIRFVEPIDTMKPKGAGS